MRIAMITVAMLAMIPGAFVLGRVYSERGSQECGESSRAAVTALASQVATAVSALTLYDKGDIDSMRQMLEARIKSGLLILYSLRESLGAEAMPSEEVRMVQEAIDSGERYAKERGLLVMGMEGSSQPSKMEFPMKAAKSKKEAE